MFVVQTSYAGLIYGVWGAKYTCIRLGRDLRVQSIWESRNSALQGSLRRKIYQDANSLGRRLQWFFLIISLTISDLLMVGLAFRAAYFVRFELSISLFQMVNPSVDYYQGLVFIIIPLWLAIFALIGLYNQKNLLAGTQEYSLVFNASTIGMISVVAAGFLLPDFIVARGWLLLAWLFAFLFTAIGRFTIRRIVYAMREMGYFLSPAVIVGVNEEAHSLAEQLTLWRKSGLLFLGYVSQDEAEAPTVFSNLPSLGSLDKLQEIVNSYAVKELILTTSALTRDEIVTLYKEYGLSKHINLRLSSGLFEVITTGVQITELASVPLVRVNNARLTGIDSVLKFILDYSITLPGLIFISPLLILIAILIKLDSPGPIIFRRRVMGVNGKQFDAYKFRTMSPNGDEILERHPELKAELDENHKLVEDPRVTRVGQILRKTSLDELPQLFNVLKREMSLVGPRMISPLEMKKYDKWDMNLLTVRPGITGLWQVSGRSNVSYAERVRLDMYYIRNWSIWLDIGLLLQTIPAVLRGRGAY
jgi:exopolysaccharide biosynthesis polyprenyl glycosylphosphotransferase